MVAEHAVEVSLEMSRNAAEAKGMSKNAAEANDFPDSLGAKAAANAAPTAAGMVNSPPSKVALPASSKAAELANGVHQIVEEEIRKSATEITSDSNAEATIDESRLFDHIHAQAVKTTTTEETGEKSDSTTSVAPRDEGRKERSPGRTSIVGDVLQSIAAGDDEGRSRQRILAFAAKRYATAVEKNPQDADALYNWALVLQESADSIGSESGPAEKDALLEEACRKYEAATRYCPTLHEAFYNWGIAVSDRAKIRGRTKEAEELWKQACQKYDRSVQLNWTSPQALNNWGLALQELGAIVPLKEKRAIVKVAISKFRAAIRLRFDFHRAVYNLGTVLYGLAEDTLRSGRRPSTKEGSASELYSASAVYIAAAHSLKPEYPVYRSALRLVRSMLPLPYIKVGHLTVPPNGNSLAPHSDWVKLWFVLDHEALYQMEKPDQRSPSYRASSNLAESSTSGSTPHIRVEVHDIACVSATADLSLPPGGCFVIDTPSGQHFMIADTWEAVDGWVDAIRLVYTIFVRGKSEALANVLAA